MTLKELLFNTVSDNKEPDAKRVAGCLGWLVCLIVSLIGVFYAIKTPDVIDTLFWTTCILLGIDGIGAIIKHRNNMKYNNKDTSDNNE